MKKWLILLAVVMLVGLSACRIAPYPSDGTESGSGRPLDHSHAPFEGDNVVEHDALGYCGNTVTTVRYVPLGGEGWEKSFWGSLSVELTDLLYHLEYSSDVCRCLPEYTVDTELSASDYGINLTQGYARYEGRQTQLTAQQVARIREILAEITAEGFGVLAG